ncbi:MAG: acyl-homoserine-lactone acylase [Proteobacteria bacterium SG_bin5]|nr:penicillin acylase family protein [Sphingomonas sp.]OQW39550.1 MAG: acyl-homoserine-lactone acylase [Proteobacteria bacterium SG_bin5]
MRQLAWGIALLALTGAAHAKPRFAATITRTSHGIPHIKAADWGGAGYGVGYAYAEDNLCLMAEEFATVAGMRSLYFGAKNKAVLGFQEIDNLSSDVFFRSQIDLPALRKRWAARPAKERALLAGYLAGYNRRLREVGAAAPEACRGKPWLKPITPDDMLRVAQKQLLLASSLALAPYIVNAAPPGKAVSAALPPLADPQERSFGSNGWAFGGEATANGRGLVIGNPHFPWNGPARFWQMHITIPGEIDVMGVGLAGTPLVTLGFNKDIAWTHTVTAAQHFTVFELPLVPGDPTRYLVDGKPVAMEARAITVPTEAGPVTRTVYHSQYGAVLTIPLLGLGWTGERAFAMRDANADNDRILAAWMGIGKARNVAEVKAAVTSTLGIPWVNTIAADRAGQALHADVTPVPNVSGEKIKACATPRSASVASRFVLLDGGRSACDWDQAPGTPRPGLMPAADQAIWERRDYLVNSNDSYWLSNARAPYKQLSPILGAWGSERTLRTRSGLIETEARLAGADGLGGAKIDNAIATQMVFANKSLAAQLALKGTLAACAGDAAVAAPCAALARWDGRFDVESRGAALFLAYWPLVEKLPGLWGTRFDPADPVNTPRDFQSGGDMAPKLRAALAKAAEQLTKQGIALDARWGEVHFALRGAERIPVHGGSGALGVLNVQQARPEAGGLVPFHGSSYIQVVSFDEAGPVADAVLSYSQSTDPASAFYADQTRLYSAKKWVRLPFTAAAIKADARGKARVISE